MSEKTRNIYTAVVEVTKAIKAVQKTGKNTYSNYTYASEADLLKELRPKMAEAGICLYCKGVHPLLEVQYGYVLNKYVYVLAHGESNTQIEVQAIGEAMDKTSKGVSDKASYKAATGALKYVLRQTFLIETGDDAEKETPEQDSSSEQEILDFRGLVKNVSNSEELVAYFIKLNAVDRKKYYNKTRQELVK
jgi:hypothetical protein